MTSPAFPPDIQAIILAGGSGTRLWPLSRQALPKQFVALLGDKTLLEATIARLAPIITPQQVTIVTGQASAIGEAMVHLAPYARHLEPCARGTAPAIAIAALNFELLGRDPVMVVLPSDHVIRDVAGFHARLNDAIAVASATDNHNLVTFGIKPTHADTGFGYIKTRPTSKTDANGSVDVDSFKEKPDLATAEGFIQDGGYYWNSGMFVWKASAILEAIRAFLPALHTTLDALRTAVKAGATFEAALAAHFASAPSISIDHGVLEKLTGNMNTSNAAAPTHNLRLQLVPADFGWSDVGSWDAVYEISNKDKDQNVTLGNTITINSKNTLVHAGKRLITTVGVEDLNIIDTPDALLITKRGESQQVREIVETLHARGATEHIEHLTVQRPWGSYTVLEGGPGFKIKRLEVKPGGRLSLQSHVHRSEHWVVVSGIATVTCGETVSDIKPNQSAYIPAGEKHRLENKGTEVVKIIEVQVGGYLGEDDIKRYEDIYGRLQTT